MTEEGRIQVAGIQYLKMTGWKVIRFNNVGMFDPTLKIFRRNINEDGISDTVNMKNGITAWVEYKKPSERELVERVDINRLPKKSHKRIWNQKRFIEDVIQHGCLGFFAFSVEDVIERLGGI